MPPLDYMIKHKVPVITGIQEAGDAVTVGIGCVHWVYSRGKTCCSAWNIGDLSFDMFEAAFRRWDDNLEIGFPSLVPMQTLALDVVEQCLYLGLKSITQKSTQKKKSTIKYDFSLLSLLRDRLDSAAYDIDNHVSMLKNILGEKLVIKSDLDMQSWNPSHCANTKCARELFSIYGKSFFFLDLCEIFFIPLFITFLSHSNTFMCTHLSISVFFFCYPSLCYYIFRCN